MTAVVREVAGARVALPVSRVGADFFRLSSRLAGEVAQKFVNYQLHLAIIGDVGAHVAASTAFRDFVYEANRGRDIWFVPDLDALVRKLGG